MPKIRDLLARRTDLSTFVVHLTREYKSRSAQENLKGILELGLIRYPCADGPAHRVPCYDTY
jgi:hypothetical protein